MLNINLNQIDAMEKNPEKEMLRENIQEAEELLTQGIADIESDGEDAVNFSDPEFIEAGITKKYEAV